MFYLRVKLRFYGLDEKSFFYFTFEIISGACQNIGIGGVGAVSWVVSEVLSNCRYVCSRCLSMLGHSGINIASGFSNIHLSIWIFKDSDKLSTAVNSTKNDNRMHAKYTHYNSTQSNYQHTHHNRIY